MLMTAKRKQLAAAGALVVALGLGMTGFAAAQDWGDVSDPQDPAKVTADAAKLAAQGAVSGTASDVKLENENGNVVYEVDLRGADGTETDVRVDAGNGTVLAPEREEAEPDDAADDAENNEANDDEEPEEVEADD